jgi:hypothetical protein
MPSREYELVSRTFPILTQGLSAWSRAPVRDSEHTELSHCFAVGSICSLAGTLPSSAATMGVEARSTGYIP